MSSQQQSLGIAGNLTKGFIRSPLTPLIMLAALAMGLIALMVVPREEEPQISVPMVNILMQAPGLKAEDAVKACLRTDGNHPSGDRRCRTCLFADNG